MQKEAYKSLGGFKNGDDAYFKKGVLSGISKITEAVQTLYDQERSTNASRERSEGRELGDGTNVRAGIAESEWPY